MKTAKNISIALVAVLGLLALCGTVEGSGPTEGLISHWEFDEGQGSIAYDSAGSNNGTLVNDTSWATGKVGSYALVFDGDDDYVQIPDSPELRFSGTQPFSVALWFKRLVDMPNHEFLLVKGFDGDPENCNYALYILDDDEAIRWMWENNSGTNYILNSGVSTSVGQWYHTVGVWDGTEQIIYVNGVKANSTVPAGAPSSGNNNPIIIGKILAGTSPAMYDFNGIIDDVRIYDRALSAEEIKLLYYNGLD